MTIKREPSYPKEWNKETIQKILRDLDRYFAQKKTKVETVVIGGVAVVLQDFQNRATNDIDIAPVADVKKFLNACRALGIDAQCITLSTTVDFTAIERIPLFRGKALTVFSVTPEDLIRLKLERFRKQDPEDIYAIIQKVSLPYNRFVYLVKEGVSDFVGRRETYLLSAQVVAETMYPDKAEAFKKQLK